MSSPLLVYGPERVVVLPPQLFGSVGYYSLMARYARAVISNDLRYDKRFKSVHRFDIADTRGVLTLTVPVSRPEGAFASGSLRWSDVDVSAHGRWWELIPTALESAYGRTPFFEFYIDRLMPLFEPRPLDKPEKITDLCSSADAIVRSILGLETVVAHTLADDGAAIDDHRRDRLFPSTHGRRYWQVRADRLGFIPDLSILDLIFSLGPEAPLILQ